MVSLRTMKSIRTGSTAPTSLFDRQSRKSRRTSVLVVLVVLCLSWVQGDAVIASSGSSSTEDDRSVVDPSALHEEEHQEGSTKSGTTAAAETDDENTCLYEDDRMDPVSTNQAVVGSALHLDLSRFDSLWDRWKTHVGQSGGDAEVSGKTHRSRRHDQPHTLQEHIANRHAFLASRRGQQRVARACTSSKWPDDDEACMEASSDCLPVTPETPYMSSSESPYLHATAGMILQVFQGHQESLSKGDSDTTLFPTIPGDRKRISPAATAMRQDYFNLPSTSNGHHQNQLPKEQSRTENDLFVFDRAYHLTEPLYLELGIAPKHYLDFAYTPPIYGTAQFDPSSFNLQGGNTEQRPIHFFERQKEHSTNWRPPSHPYLGKSKHGNSNRFLPPIVETFPPSLPASAIEPQDEETCVDLEEAISEDCKAILDPKRDFHEESHSQDWWKWWFSFTSTWWRTDKGHDSEYTMGRSAFAGGSHGQVWRGRRVCGSNNVLECDEEKPLILKRLKVENGYRLLEAGLREVYFGQWIQSIVEEAQKGLFTVYVDHFFRELPRSIGPNGQRKKSKDLELWIVFEDAGPSLRSYMYAPVASNGFVMYQHSRLWSQLRMAHQEKTSVHTSSTDDDYQSRRLPFSNETSNNEEINISGVWGQSGEDPDRLKSESTNNHDVVTGMGRHVFKNVLHQVLSAAAILHSSGIVHRDIKPSNVMCVTDAPLDDLYAFETLPKIQCRLGDFSSGWDKYTKSNLYTKGPSPAEQTDEYAPPESYIGKDWVPFDARRPQSYDSWSIGVLALEMLLGTPNVFSVDQRTTALLTSKMRKKGASDEELQRALYLAALSNFCIYVPNAASKDQQTWPLRHGDPLYETTMVRETCTLQDFHRALRARDPLGIGFDSSTDLLLHLIWQLLEWDPIKRMTASAALDHPFFHTDRNSDDPLRDITRQQVALNCGDPRLDIGMDDEVHEFICPKCGRVFHDWRSCIRHANTRRHAKFCSYDRSNLPTCINTHSMLPAHPKSGYCDLQGRRPTIEDFHSIHLNSDVQFYGMFDGHTGNVASKYVASTLFERLMDRLPGLKGPRAIEERPNWRTQIETNTSEAFLEAHEGFLDAVSIAPTMDQSGTTATAMLVTDDVIVVASLGDSRAVLSSTTDGSISAIPLTVDHVASNRTERSLVIERGGFISSSGGIDRVNGTLAITRSIGDTALAPVLSREPHVVSMLRKEVIELCGDGHPCFVVLASDGLWDVMSSEEAVNMVAEVIATYESTDRVSWNNGGAFQEAAEVLAVDAYVRGSTDNIGVCVVSLIEAA